MVIRRLVIPLVLLVAGGSWWWFASSSPKAAPAAPRAEAVPVVAASVAQQSVPLWLSGLGTVQAYNTVTVRPRISGSLDEIHFTEGQMVREGDILARIDPRIYRTTLETAVAQKAQNDAIYLNSKRQLERLRMLVEGNAESRRMFEEQEATVAQYAARQQADQVAIDAAQLDLDFTTIRAPISGKTGIRLVDVGNLVSANQAEGLVVITQLQPISAILSLPQNTLPALQQRYASDPSALVVEALAENGKILATGELELIDNQIDTSTGTLRLKVRFPNEEQALWPGQFLTARVLVEVRENAKVVPAEAIQPGQNGPFVYAIKPDQTVEARLVRVGPTVEGITIIEDGLSAGEKVVREGQNRLQPGAKVAPQDSKL